MGFYDQPGRDGRRKSDPLTTPNTSPTRAPKYQLYRHVIANDAAASPGTPEKKSIGCNFGGYEVGLIKMVPRVTSAINGAEGGSGAVSLAVEEWSEGAQRFVKSDLGPLTLAGAGVAQSFQFNARGRILFFRVSALGASNSVSIYASGSDASEFV